LLPAIILASISVAVAALLPAVYRSSATILIEEPNIPRELVSSTITSYADQRLQSIYHRVTTTQNVTTIINHQSNDPRSYSWTMDET
jgi:uncharacterized protein involved in exopolysaccharide biosynthesis